MTLSYAADPTVFWQQAVDLYRAEAAHIDDPHEAASLLVEAGEVLAEQLGQVDDAYAAFDAAQARAPDAVAPLLARARLAEGQADWTEATECLRAALGRLTGTRRVPVLSTLAEICARNLGRPDEAVRLLQEAVTLAPDQRDLLIRLETARPGTEIAARREVLERRLAVTTSLAERGERLAELGGLLEANAPAKAARTFADAYAANPNWAPAVHGLIRTYVDLKRWEALGRALRTHAERITDDVVRAEVYAVCGVIADAHGADSARAVADLENAQSIPGVAEDLVLARDRAGLATDEWWADATDPSQAGRRAYHMAAAGRGRLDGPLGAVIGRRRALATGDDDIIGEAHAALTRHAVTDEDARIFHMAEGDEALWSTAPHEARAGYLAAVARQTNTACFPEGLIGLRAVARTTDDLDAWRRQVDAALIRTTDDTIGASVRLWRATNDPTATEVDAWLAMAEAEPSHFGAMDAALAGTAAGIDLSALVDAAVDAAQSPTRKVRLLLVGADRRAASNDLEGACDRWRAVLSIDPLEVTARNALGRTLHHRGHTEGLAKLIETELAALSTDDARHQDAWLRYARLRSTNGDAPAALEMLRGQADQPWSSRLEIRRLADSLGNEMALKAVLEQPAASPVEVRTDTLERAGVLLDLGETRGATEAVDAVLTDAPADVLGAWVRAQLALSEGDAAHALRLTQHQLATARTPGLARINAHRLTAQLPLAEGRALMAERAAEDADAAWYMLCDAAAAGDSNGVVQRLEQLAALVGDRTAQAILLEAGERAEALGLDPEERRAIWSRVVEESPGRATQMLLGLYAESADLDEHVAALTQLAMQADRPAQAAVALWRAGLLLEDTFPQEASRLYWQAIEAWPDDPVALLLALRVGDGGAPLDGADRAQQLEAIAARLVHDARAARLLASAAALRETQGEDSDARRTWLYAAMRYPEQDALANRALGLLADEDEARIALLEARVRRTTTTAAKAQARHQLAREYIDFRGDRVGAASVFEQIVQATPGDLAARQEYASLLVGLGRHADAVAQYRIAAQTSAEPSARVALYTRIGELLARHLNDLDGAIQALRQAIGLVDPTGRAQEVLAEVYLRAGEGNRALLAYQRLERMVGDSARRAQARAGQVRALMSDGREADARARLLGFLKADPFDPLLGTLARALNVEVPEPDEPDEIEEAPATNGIDLAELDRLSAALDRSQSRQTQADNAVAQASAEAAAMLDLQAFDALEAALAQVTAARAPAVPEVPEPARSILVAEPPETEPPAAVEPAAVEPAAVEAAAVEPDVIEGELSTDSWAALDVADEPIADESAPDELVADEPVADESAADESAADELVADEPVADEPVADELVADELVADEPVADELVADEPVADELVADELVADEPVADEPIADEPVADELASDELASDEPIADELVADEPVADEPVADEPVADEPVADELAADELAADELEPAADDVEAEHSPIVASEPVDASSASFEAFPVFAETVAADPIALVAVVDQTMIDADAIEEALDAEAREKAVVIDQVEREEVYASAVRALADLPPPFESVETDVLSVEASAGPQPVEVELDAALLDPLPVDPEAPSLDPALPATMTAEYGDDSDDFDDFEVLSSFELEAWEIEEIETPVVLVSAKPPPMPPELPPEVIVPSRTPSDRPPARSVSAPPAILQSTDALAALREVHSALGVPVVPRPEPPSPESRQGSNSLADLMARVDAVVDADMPQSAISTSLLDTPAEAAVRVAPMATSAPPANLPPESTEQPDDVRTWQALRADEPQGEADLNTVVASMPMADKPIAQPAVEEPAAEAPAAEEPAVEAPAAEEPAVEALAAEALAAEALAAEALAAEALAAEALAAEALAAEALAAEALAVEALAAEALAAEALAAEALAAEALAAEALAAEALAVEALAAEAPAQSPEVDHALDLDAFDTALFDDGDDDAELTDAEAELGAGSRSAPADANDLAAPERVPSIGERAENQTGSDLSASASMNHEALPAGPFRAALDRQVALAVEPEAEAPPIAPEPTAEQMPSTPEAVQPGDEAADAGSDPSVDSLDQAETGEMMALHVNTQEPLQASIEWLPIPDSAPPNPFGNLPATLVQPSEMALFEGEPTVVRFNELAESAARAPDAADVEHSEPEPLAPSPVDQTTGETDISSVEPAAARAEHTAFETDAAEQASVDVDGPDDDEDDFFGDAPDLLDSLLDAQPKRVERPSANITRTRGARTTGRPSGSLSGYRRSTDTSAPPASMSVDRVLNAAAFAASIARGERDDPSRPSQALAAVVLRRQSGGHRMDPLAARARIATNPVDIEAWASLRIATSRGGSARWIADMRAWLDGRMHTGSVVGVPSRLPDALREGLRPASAPLALIRMLRALRTRVPLGLAQAHRPDSLYSLDAHEPLTEVADRVAVALGCPMHDLMLDRAQPYALRVLADAVPVVCIGDALLPRVPEPGRSFLVGRGLAVLAEGTLPAEILNDAAFLGFLAAVFDLLGLGGSIVADPAMTAAAAAWVQPVVDPHDETLKTLALQVLASFQDVPASAARLGLQTYTRRLALAVTDGLGGALEVMRLLDLDERPLESLTEADRQTFFESNPAARDLVECAASAPCLAVRDWLVKNR